MILGIAAIFVAPAIKLESPGPVFFGQTRIGRNGRRFTFLQIPLHVPGCRGEEKGADGLQ